VSSRFRELSFNAKLDQVVILRGGYSKHNSRRSKSRTSARAPAKSSSRRPESANRLATPVNAVDALVGKLSPYVIIGTVQAAVVIGIARLLFDLPATGDLWALLIAVPLYSAAHLIVIAAGC
jgi:hypothetical protein